MIAKNICEIEAEAQAVFNELGYSKSKVDLISRTGRTLIHLHNEQEMVGWNDDIVENWVKYQERRYHQCEISRNYYIELKATTGYLKQIYNTGAFTKSRYRRLPPHPAAFEEILEKILANQEWNHKASKYQYSLTSTFFRWLHARGHVDLSRVDECVVGEYLTECAAKMAGTSLDKTRKGLKTLFLFVSGDDKLPEPMNRLFAFKVPIEKKIRPFIAHDDIAAVLNIIDRNTAKGKRDYAIILLAAVTGLRSIDIAELRLGVIDWGCGELRIIQEKTGGALALPLTTDVGKAIRNYILNARPSSTSNKVFLRVRAPFDALNRSTISGDFKVYRRKAGLSEQMGFHSLRRSVATNMIIHGVSVITTAQALGHKSINSTKRYISLDSQNLKECALDFSGIQVGGAQW